MIQHQLISMTSSLNMKLLDLNRNVSSFYSLQANKYSNVSLVILQLWSYCLWVERLAVLEMAVFSFAIIPLLLEQKRIFQDDFASTECHRNRYFSRVQFAEKLRDFFSQLGFEVFDLYLEADVESVFQSIMSAIYSANTTIETGIAMCSNQVIYSGNVKVDTKSLHQIWENAMEEVWLCKRNWFGEETRATHLLEYEKDDSGLRMLRWKGQVFHELMQVHPPLFRGPTPPPYNLMATLYDMLYSLRIRKNQHCPLHYHITEYEIHMLETCIQWGNIALVLHRQLSNQVENVTQSCVSVVVDPIDSSNNTDSVKQNHRLLLNTIEKMINIGIRYTSLRQNEADHAVRKSIALSNHLGVNATALRSLFKLASQSVQLLHHIISRANDVTPGQLISDHCTTDACSLLISYWSELPITRNLYRVIENELLATYLKILHKSDKYVFHNCHEGIPEALLPWEESIIVQRYLYDIVHRGTSHYDHMSEDDPQMIYFRERVVIQRLVSKIYTLLGYCIRDTARLCEREQPVRFTSVHSLEYDRFVESCDSDYDDDDGHEPWIYHGPGHRKPVPGVEIKLQEYNKVIKHVEDLHSSYRKRDYLHDYMQWQHHHSIHNAMIICNHAIRRHVTVMELYIILLKYRFKLHSIRKPVSLDYPNGFNDLYMGMLQAIHDAIQLIVATMESIKTTEQGEICIIYYKVIESYSFWLRTAFDISILKQDIIPNFLFAILENDKHMTGTPLQLHVWPDVVTDCELFVINKLKFSYRNFRNLLEQTCRDNGSDGDQWKEVANGSLSVDDERDIGQRMKQVAEIVKEYLLEQEEKKRIVYQELSDQYIFKSRGEFAPYEKQKDIFANS